MARRLPRSRRTGIGPMQFGRSTIGWGASASPAARAAGAGYGALPRTSQSGTLPGPGARRLLAPWGNNYPKRYPTTTVIRGSARRMPIQDRSELGMVYPANDPRYWPIEGSKTRIFDQAGKANRHNAIVDHAFARAGYAPQVSYPTYSGTDLFYAEQ